MGDPLTSGWFWGMMEVFRGSGAVVAQLLPKQWVAGSNPVSRSRGLQARSEPRLLEIVSGNQSRLSQNAREMGRN